MVPEVVQTADMVLQAKEHLIVDGRINGVPWMVQCFRDAVEIVRRRRRQLRRARAAGD